MHTKLFGRSELRVSELCLGTMSFGRAGAGGTGRRDGEAMLGAFAERGGNFIDTAPAYGDADGEAERIVGGLVAAERARWVLATRARVPASFSDPRGELVAAVEGSLRRLGTDRVELLWLEGWDHESAFAEVMEALDSLVRAGKVLHVGVADSPSWVAAQANTLAAVHGWTPFVGLQLEYCLAERRAEQQSLPAAEAFGLAVCPWGALAGGALGGRSRRGSLAAPGRAGFAAELVKEVALDLGVAPATVALSWLRQQAANLVPIVGARTLPQLLEDLACVELTLSTPQLRRLSGRALIERWGPRSTGAQAFA